MDEGVVEVEEPEGDGEVEGHLDPPRMVLFLGGVFCVEEKDIAGTIVVEKRSPARLASGVVETGTFAIAAPVSKESPATTPIVDVVVVVGVVEVITEVVVMVTGGRKIPLTLLKGGRVLW